MNNNSVLEKENKNEDSIANIILKVIDTELKDDVVNITLIDDNDKKYKLKLLVDDYVLSKIRPNNFVFAETYNLYKERENYLLAYKSCLRRLAIKDYSINKIKDILKTNYKLSIEEIDEIVNKLISLNYLDDERYTKYRIQYLQNSTISKNAIIEKLKKEGISPSLIKDGYFSLNEKENAIIKAQKYLKSSKGKSSNYAKKQIYSKLICDGYSNENVMYAIDQLDFKQQINDKDIIKKTYDKLYQKYSKKYSGYELKNKLYSSLMIKGFNGEDIKEILNNTEE